MPKSPALTRETALIIDANSLIHRAWHALPPLTAPDGRLVNAAYGFTSVLLKILQTEHPTYLVVAWDTPEPTYRHTARKEYKAHREEQPDAFYEQMPIVKEVVEVLGGVNVELPGFEADDLLATFAARFSARGVEVTLMTSDKDVWQVIGPGIRLMAFKKGVSETVVYDEKMLKEVSGLRPDQVADFKAMRGDPSDNLKGVPGIGEKTATELLKAYDTLEGIFTAAHDPKSTLSPSVRKRLVDGEQEAREILPIVRLDADAPLEFTLKKLSRKTVDEAMLRETFMKLGFKTLLTRVLGGKREPSDAGARVPARKKPETVFDVLDAIRKEKFLVIRPIEPVQSSLFAASSAVAMGSRNISCVLPAIPPELPSLLADPDIQKIGHGLKDAWHWARRQGLELNGIHFDTEIACQLLAAGEGGHDLPSLAAARLGTALPDTEDRPIAEVDAIRSLAQLLEKELEEQTLSSVMSRFEMPLIHVLAEMEEHGVLIDRTYFQKLTDDFRTEKARLEREMEKLAGEPFNPGSPQQLARILFDVLKVPIKGLKRGKTGISTAASELEKLEGAHPIISKISEYREVAKLLSTYVEALPALADNNGRVHTTYNQLGAATGRMSSTNPNLQNIPIRTELGRKIRRGFIAAKGNVLLSCDYSQIELRVIAALAKDAKMIEAFERGLDIHTATAAAIWHVPLEEVTKDQRRAAKAINFGIIYGQGPVGLSKGAGISFDEAKRFIEEYFHVYSGVREYLEQTKALAHARGYVETLFGRRRPIPDINSPLPQFRAAAERMAINMPVQGTATGDLVKLALIAIQKELPTISKRARLLLQVHDEVVLEVPEKEVDAVAKGIIDIMQTVEKIGVPIVVDAKHGKNWDEMKKM